jgi:hypothetical protein
MEIQKTVSTVELKRLLHELYDKQSYTYVRFRLLGEMWQPTFLQIFDVGEHAAIFFNESSRQLLRIGNISTIVQFEIDHNFQQYQAHFHYDVTLEEVTA